MFMIWLEKILLKLEIVTLTLTLRKYLIHGSLITNFFQNKFDCGMEIWAKEPSESLTKEFSKLFGSRTGSQERLRQLRPTVANLTINFQK